MFVIQQPSGQNKGYVLLTNLETLLRGWGIEYLIPHP